MFTPALSQGFCLGHFFAKGHHGLRCCFAPAGTKEATTTLHVLSLLRDLLPCFPAAVVKTCCETLLRVMTLSHVVSVPVLGMGRAAPLPLAVPWKGSNPVGCQQGAWKWRMQAQRSPGQLAFAGLPALDEGG